MGPVAIKTSQSLFRKPCKWHDIDTIGVFDNVNGDRKKLDY